MQFYEVIKEYPNLILFWEGDIAVIEGDLHFIAAYNGVQIEDTYKIKIVLPHDYPNSLPVTKEIGNRIPSYFHKFTDDSLCLEVYAKIKLEFSEKPSLLFYIQRFVVQYLFSYSYKKTYGELPYGERSHGDLGILEFYHELLGISDSSSIIGALRILAKGVYRGHHLCFCGSGLKLRSCHGQIIRNLIDKKLNQQFRNDLISIINYNKECRRR
jgi:hypothetical protein